jgi:hypothetical protein
MSSSLNMSKSNIIPEQITVKHSNKIVYDVILPSTDFFNDSDYYDLISKVKTFTNDNNNSLITFIIPTINRIRLFLTIKSLLSQKINNWKAIIIFDGCRPTNSDLINLLNDNRFLYFSINKLGIIKDITHGAAGFVRNIGMNLVTTPWIGFIDDDDILLPNYTSSLVEELNITPNVDLITFRMIDNKIIIPQSYTNDIEHGNIGISFCYKTKLFREGFKFIQSEKEDYDLINSVKNAKKKIIISPYITYIVRNSSIFNNKLKRVIIN